MWNSGDADAVDRFVVDDFVIVTGGDTITGREDFKNWVRQFLSQVTDLRLTVSESFQNAEGDRVASRWVLTGKNKRLLGTLADQRAITLTGTAVWAVREDGKLLQNWVERASWELSQRLNDAG